MSVPGNAEIGIEMQAENWGFGDVAGRPRAQDAALLTPRRVTSQTK